MTSQLQNILTALRNADGEFVSAFTLHEASGSLCVHSRISDLRKAGHVITNRTRHEHGRCISEYRLSESPPLLARRATVPIILQQGELLAAPHVWPD